MPLQQLTLQHNAENILRLSKRMLMHAQQQDWDELSRLEDDRSRALHNLFDHPQIDASLPMLSDVLHEVLELDRQCILLTEQARFAMLQHLRRHRRGDHAACAYRNNEMP